MQPDPTLNEGRASAVGITAAALATAVILIVVLYSLSQPPREPATGGSLASAPPATTEPTGQGNTGPGMTEQATTNRARPQPAEQDPIEQTTRP